MAGSTVTMTFDAKIAPMMAAAKKAADATAGIEGAHKKLSKQLRKSSQEIKKNNKAFEDTGKSTKKSEQALGKFGGKLKALAGPAGAIGILVAAFGAAFRQISSDIQAAETQVKATIENIRAAYAENKALVAVSKDVGELTLRELQAKSMSLMTGMTLGESLRTMTALDSAGLEEDWRTFGKAHLLGVDTGALARGAGYVKSNFAEVTSGAGAAGGIAMVAETSSSDATQMAEAVSKVAGSMKNIDENAATSLAALGILAQGGKAEQASTQLGAVATQLSRTEFGKEGLSGLIRMRQENPEMYSQIFERGEVNAVKGAKALMDNQAAIAQLQGKVARELDSGTYITERAATVATPGLTKAQMLEQTRVSKELLYRERELEEGGGVDREIGRNIYEARMIQEGYSNARIQHGMAVADRQEYWRKWGTGWYSPFAGTAEDDKWNNQYYINKAKESTGGETLGEAVDISNRETQKVLQNIADSTEAMNNKTRGRSNLRPESHQSGSKVGTR